MPDISHTCPTAITGIPGKARLVIVDLCGLKRSCTYEQIRCRYQYIWLASRRFNHERIF